MPDYSSKLGATKASYPFKQWEESGVDQYTPEACSAFVTIFDGLIADLAAKGEAASADEKLECFHQAVLALNAINEQDESLIETGEREDLCELCNIVATAAGLDPSKYGDGEGPATEWRDW
ncbi:MAG TPA: hypothetical protein VF614_05460 [Chthoniobacteraceae bacterium]|jgi:hypothetical protein